MIRFHLKWWMDTNRFASGMSIHPPEPTDASHFEWRAHLELMRLSFQGHWLKDQSQLHISIFVMMANRLAMKKATKYNHHSCVMISTYNTTVVSDLYQQTRRNTFSQPMHRSMENPPLLPGIQYKYQSSSCPRQIQQLGRPSIETRQATQTEWALDQSVTNSIFQMLNYHNVDLFLTRFNHNSHCMYLQFRTVMP